MHKSSKIIHIAADLLSPKKQGTINIVR